MPCHPGTWATGIVTDNNGTPIENAEITLYSSTQFTKSDGGFRFELADALPFKLTASANGYKFAESPSKSGYFFIEIKLAELNSEENSQIFWKKISSGKYYKLKSGT